MKHLTFMIIFTLTTFVYGQTLTKLTIKAGTSISGQKKSPDIFISDTGIKLGFAGTIEPTILTFGLNKQFDFNTDISFIQKGGYNTSPVNGYDQYGQHVRGLITYPITINYLSFSPIFKIIFWKKIFLKAGPRMDTFLSFNNQKSRDPYPSDKRTNKDFNSFTFGLTYGTGINFGRKRTKLLIELVGQNDFTNSSSNGATGQIFKNYSYIINCGVTIQLKNKSE